MAVDVQEPSGSSSSKKELDPDQIQNLFNMALSNAYDTVSSWLQPPSAAVIAADEKLKMSNHEFEKLAFRPLRLGVGAAAPSSSTPKEMYKLKQKLSGTKRKVDEIDSTNRKGKAKAEAEEDDDEESKSQSVTKKLKLSGTSALLAFEPNESVAKSKKKKKKKDKGHLDPGSVASEEKDALPPPGHANSSTSAVIWERDASSQALAASTAREERDSEMAERAESQAGSVEPEALPPDVSEKKRKKKKRKTSGEEHGRKSKLPASGGGDGDKDEDQGAWEDDGEEWMGIPAPPPPPESDMGLPPKPSKPTRAPSPDLKSNTTLDSRIYRHRPPRPTDTPITQATHGASIPSAIPSSSQPFGSLTPSPSPNERTGIHSHPSTSLLPTIPNGDSSSPHKKKKRRKRVLLDQAQALDEQSSEATLVSSSDHTARMTSPRE